MGDVMFVMFVMFGTVLCVGGVARMPERGVVGNWDDGVGVSKAIRVNVPYASPL